MSLFPLCSSFATFVLKPPKISLHPPPFRQKDGPRPRQTGAITRRWWSKPRGSGRTTPHLPSFCIAPGLGLERGRYWLGQIMPTALLPFSLKCCLVSGIQTIAPPPSPRIGRPPRNLPTTINTAQTIGHPSSLMLCWVPVASHTVILANLLDCCTFTWNRVFYLKSVMHFFHEE